jgi:hypothetical protein
MVVPELTLVDFLWPDWLACVVLGTVLFGCSVFDRVKGGGVGSLPSGSFRGEGGFVIVENWFFLGD